MILVVFQGLLFFLFGIPFSIAWIVPALLEIQSLFTLLYVSNSVAGIYSTD